MSKVNEKAKPGNEKDKKKEPLKEVPKKQNERLASPMDNSKRDNKSPDPDNSFEKSSKNGSKPMTPNKSERSFDMLDKSVDSKGSRNRSIIKDMKKKNKKGLPPEEKKKVKKEPKKEKKILPLDQQTEKTLRKNGMLDAYQYVMLNICKNGLPVGNIFEYASFLIMNYEKKWKKIQAEKIKEKIMRYKEDKQKSLGSHGIDINDRSLNMSLDYSIRVKTPKRRNDYESLQRSKSAKKSQRSHSSKDKNSPPKYQVNYNLNSLKKSIEYAKSHADIENEITKIKNDKKKQRNEKNEKNDEFMKTGESSKSNSVLKTGKSEDSKKENEAKKENPKSKKEEKKIEAKKDAKSESVKLKK